jgi:hypothetical protein
MKKKIIKIVFISLFVIPILLIGIVVTILYTNQKKIVKSLIEQVNLDFNGRVQIEDSHIEPFTNFPYISIDLESLRIFETKDSLLKPIVDVKDIYIGFDIFNLLQGKKDIKLIKLKNGEIHLIQELDGKLNIANAFQSTKPSEKEAEELHLSLSSILLENIDVTKINKEGKLLIETFITYAKTKFSTSSEKIAIAIDAQATLNIIQNNDTTFFKRKHINIASQFDYFKKENKIVINPTEIKLEHALFGIEGSIDFDNNIFVDVKIKGDKPNFDLFTAFAPEELASVLNKYDNKGKILFNATIYGDVSNSKKPLVNVDFRCENAFLNNTETNRRLNDLNFKAHFTNGEARDLSTMQFSLTDFSSRPESGIFKGYLIVKNFNEPEIDTKIISDFDLDFLQKFIGLKGLEDLQGKIKLTMNFKDIIDLNHPEKSIEKLNESYFTELIVTNLSFKSKKFHLPIKNLNINAILVGHEAKIKQFNLIVGNSDVSIKGSISDLPAIIHHTKDPVTSLLEIKSKILDINELTTTKTKKGFDEQIENLSMKFKFKSSAKAFTESPNLPVGEFFIEDLYAKLKHYPHVLHDFHADLLIDTSNFRIIDFTGVIDNSDFHFNGKLKNYDLWFTEKYKGDTEIDFNLTSNLLQLHDVFSYKGENYVPEDYRHEELKSFKLHGNAKLHFKEKLHSIDLDLDQFSALMKLHHFKFEKFKGLFHLEDDHITIKQFSGNLGKSNFLIDLNYYLGKDETIKKRDNHFGIKSNNLDFDELFMFKTTTSETKNTTAEHEKGFNIYELPFTDMTFDININNLKYHRYLIHNIKGKLKSTQNHYLYIDTLTLEAADGKIDMSGYFNGSNKDKIYFSPKLNIRHIDIDKLLFKFENFGQDHLVSENINGQFTGLISGNIRMHRDLVPIINESEIHLDAIILNGKLENYAPLKSLSEYFKDKNIAKISFDTLQNHIDLNKGVMSFPNMTINSSLGFIEIAGKQDLNGSMEYYLRIPLKLVTAVAKDKLFGTSKSKEIAPEQEDEIQYKDDLKKIKYVNLKISGTSDNMKFTLGKNK